jgi:heptosyltransferase-2
MHIASAAGVPTVAVFGATDHVGTGPTGPLSRVVREPVDCSPCLLRECPIDHRCMTRISAGRVAETALELLK